jgi:hypothetical protein
MTVDQGSHVVREIDALDSLDVRDTASLGVVSVERVRLAQHCVSTHPTREYFESTLIQFGAS